MLRRTLRLLLAVLLLALPAWLVLAYYPRVDQSGNRAARQMWAEVLAAQPPSDAVLVSNDRDEIVPLYYLQAVEGVAPRMTGLFPLITREPRFADVGAVIATGLATGRPVYLVKPMPGLEVRFDLQAGQEPLVQVTGPAAARPPSIPLAMPYGPLVLAGYDWQDAGEAIEVVLYWQVREPLDAVYTTTVQIFDGHGEKIAQDDGVAGSQYYPPSLWKPGELLIDRRRLPAIPNDQPARMLVGMYRTPSLEHLAAPLQIERPGHR